MTRQSAAGVIPAVFLSLAIVVGVPKAALAGPVEELIQMAVGPADPNMLVLRYEWSGDGLLYSRDGGATFTFVCGSSVSDPTLDEAPLQKLGPIGIAGSGEVLLGVFGGLWRDDGKGCSWSKEEALAGRWVTDIEAHPSDPEVSFLITSNGGEAENGVVRRNADGTFTDVGEKKQMLINRLRVIELPEGGLRFYESGVLGQVPFTDPETGAMTTKPNYVIRVSDDEGETWTEHQMGVLDGAMRLEAVDPTDPDRIVISIGRDRDATTNLPIPDSVMVSDDKGETFSEWTTVTQFGAIAFASDGRVWLGDAGESSSPEAPRGIKHADSLAQEPEVLTDEIPIRCLHHTGDRLFACQRFSFGRVSVEDGTFTPALELSKLESMNQCDGVDTESVCRKQMCTGECGTGHFASAPICIEAYGSTEETGCAPVSAGTGGAGGAGVATGGMSGEGGASGDGATTGGAGGVGAAGTAVAGMMADEPDEESASSSGCGCRTVGASSGPRGDYVGYIWLGMLALAARLVRRRRPS